MYIHVCNWFPVVYLLVRYLNGCHTMVSAILDVYNKKYVSFKIMVFFFTCSMTVSEAVSHSEEVLEGANSWMETLGCNCKYFLK